MIRLKPGVKLAGVTPQILLALQVAEGIWWGCGQTDLVVTSANDSEHCDEAQGRPCPDGAPRSKHYDGCAVDLRTKTLPAADKGRALALLKGSLTTEYQVVVEAMGTEQEHVHIEWDPR